LKRNKEKQLSFLDNLAPLVKPGGVLVYAVCSNEPEENEDVIETFLNKHSDFVIDNHHGELFFKAGLFVDQKGYLKTFPHRHHTDGFFFVRVKCKK
jgi:16S rRNA (cytosine967-C5)-methyltransferase